MAEHLRQPPLATLLDEVRPGPEEGIAGEQKQVIEKTLVELGVEAQVSAIHEGPTVRQFSLIPGPEVKLSQLKGLEIDLALALSGLPVRIEEPTPTHPYLRLVVPKQARRPVKLRQILETPEFNDFEGILKVGLGLDDFGKPVVIDLAALPHLLIGGATGTGKSVSLNAMIASLLCIYPPGVVQFLLIDPARVELKNYNVLPHLFVPVITRSERVLDALDSVNTEINRRFTEYSKLGVRDIAAYNHRAPLVNKPLAPYLVIVIDNLVDLMLRSPQEVEQSLSRIAALGRSAGVHLIIATQRSNVDIVSGAIKANASGRIAFRVTSSADSRLILDTSGAEELFGFGDMLYRGPGAPVPRRVQGVYVSEGELERIIRYWQS